MSEVFGPEYSSQYDLFYADKDYEAECNFLEDIFRTFSNTIIHRILDLGCGTGGHALPLAQRGYAVVGIDRSSDMLALARQKAAQRALDLEFWQGDVRNADLAQRFDAVVSMFAVIGYQTDNADLEASFNTARRHLAPGGLFVFDCWFGPAVLATRPAERCRILESSGERVIRLVQPRLDIMTHTVEVTYRVLRIKGKRVVNEVEESHKVRFLFPAEVSYFLQKSDLRLRHFCPFMALDRRLGEGDWNLTVVAEG